MTPAHTARVLVQALPYIRRFAGKSVVVKLGGAAIDAELDRALAQDVLLLRSVGVRCVLVHGGGPQVDVMMRRVGLEPEFRDGLRVTDAQTLEIVRMVLVGKINRDLVATINREALEEPVAVGVSGEDAGLLTVPRGTRRSASSETWRSFAPRSSTDCSTRGLPLLSRQSVRTREGSPTTSTLTRRRARSPLPWGRRRSSTSPPHRGCLQTSTTRPSLIPRLTRPSLRQRIGHESVSAGMIPKLRACADAVEGGVGTAHILDGRVPHSLLIELLTDEGIGTMIAKRASW
jgi:acetylglutamate kinase